MSLVWVNLLLKGQSIQNGRELKKNVISPLLVTSLNLTSWVCISALANMQSLPVPSGLYLDRYIILCNRRCSGIGCRREIWNLWQGDLPYFQIPYSKILRLKFPSIKLWVLYSNPELHIPRSDFEFSIPFFEFHVPFSPGTKKKPGANSTQQRSPYNYNITLCWLTLKLELCLTSIGIFLRINSLLT